jgi:hypothetical protein
MSDYAICCPAEAPCGEHFRRTPRHTAVEAMLERRYNGAIPVTDEMVQAVLDALDEED